MSKAKKKHPVGCFFFALLSFYQNFLCTTRLM